VKTISTIGSLIENGYRLFAHHDVVGEGRCTHSAQLDLLVLEKKLGPDFDMVTQRERFLAMLTCSACAKQDPRSHRSKGKMSLIFLPPTSPGEGARIGASRRNSARPPG
jgi:hypothetical protein